MEGDLSDQRCVIRRRRWNRGMSVNSRKENGVATSIAEEDEVIRVLPRQLTGVYCQPSLRERSYAKYGVWREYLEQAGYRDIKQGRLGEQFNPRARLIGKRFMPEKDPTLDIIRPRVKLDFERANRLSLAPT